MRTIREEYRGIRLMKTTRFSNEEYYEEQIEVMQIITWEFKVQPKREEE